MNNEFRFLIINYVTIIMAMFITECPSLLKQSTLHATDIGDLICDKDHFWKTICDLIYEK